MLKYLVFPVAIIAGVAVAHNVISRPERIPVVTAQEKPAAMRTAEKAPLANQDPRSDAAKPDTAKATAAGGPEAAAGKVSPATTPDPKKDEGPAAEASPARPGQKPDANKGVPAKPSAAPAAEPAPVKQPAEKAETKQSAQDEPAKPAAAEEKIVERDAAQFDTEKMVLPADANPPLVKREDVGTIPE